MSITVDEDLYRDLKRTAGPRGMSKFIADSVRRRLRSAQTSLYEEYLDASKDKDRQQVIEDWETTETEGWR
jgi:hypothetical protein